ncbi:MAG: ABC transporter substrate-binding protein [Desulfobacteraceae bacterium]|nr:ABC transporter substrate-binding protein [Desulfobacteraceae bacterium]
MRKLIVIIFCLAFLAASLNATHATEKDIFIKSTIATLRTLDPARSYDDESRMKLENLYERLIHFDGPYTDRFAPVLATEVPSIENGGISKDGLTYTFKIRKGVKFHNGEIMTAEDVAYCLKRAMICDPDGGPNALLLEPVTGRGVTRDNDGKIIPGVFEKIDKAVLSKGDTVVIRLHKPFPPLLGIIAYTNCSIYPKKWAMENGCWDGNIKNAAKFNGPPNGKEPLHHIENGSGPYVMKEWKPSQKFVFERFDDYWGGKPNIRVGITQYIPEWTTRKLMFQNSDLDMIEVPPNYINEMESIKGIKIHKVPQLMVTCAMFCQKIDPTANPNIGSGKLDGDGIPPDFFSDYDVRAAFAHTIDFKALKEDACNNLIEIPSSPNIKGLPYSKDVKHPEFDLKKAADHMKKAWGGKAWEMGFKMVITFNTGRIVRETAAHMMAENIVSLNPKFDIEVRNVDWADYLVTFQQYKYPVFLIAWGADYPDPHNFLYNYLHSDGHYTRYSVYKNPEADRLVEEGIATVDPVRREQIYTRLQNIWNEDIVGVALAQRMVIRAYQDNIQGFIPNPLYSGAAEHFKTLTKQ